MFVQQLASYGRLRLLACEVVGKLILLALRSARKLRMCTLRSVTLSEGAEMRCGRSAFRLLVLGFRPSRPFAEESSDRITAKPKYSGTSLIPCSPTTVTQQAAAKSGYQFTSGTGTVFGTVTLDTRLWLSRSHRSAKRTWRTPSPPWLPVPAGGKVGAANQTGIRAFCGEEGGVVRVDPTGACSSVEATIPDIQP